MPDTFGNMVSLYDVDLGSNQLSGSLALSLQSLSNLRLLFADNNRFTGSIPPSILSSFGAVGRCNQSCNPRELDRTTDHLSPYCCSSQEFLDLSNNQLEGSLPFELFSKMKHLGTFGSYVVDLSRKKTVDSSSRTHIVSLKLASNKLTGSIPPEIESMHRLELVGLGQNNLSGELPNVFGRLHHLGRSTLTQGDLLVHTQLAFMHCRGPRSSRQ